MCNNLFLLLFVVIIASKYLEVVSTDRKSSIFESTEEYPTSCKDVLNQGRTDSDIYVIQPKHAPEPFSVFCNMESSEGGWTTILNRVDGSQDFNKNWDNYKQGIGNLYGEFWLGLDKIHYITRYEVNELLFELVDWDGEQTVAHYDYFGIGSEEEGYILNLLGGYSGSAGDSFILDAGTKFSTSDKDQDTYMFNCAETYKAGWWFIDCGNENPTGTYYSNSNNTDGTGIFWTPWHGTEYSLKEVRMMIRPRGW